jgi:dihydroorotate dehydrogenase electron transfer subunit
MEINYTEGTVVSNAALIDAVYDMVLAAPEIFNGGGPKAGQFIGLYTGGGVHLLPRPLSICETLRSDRMLRLVYKAAGKGTELFSRLEPGARLNLLGPLGNGFTPAPDAGKHVVIGGGVGVVPLLELSKILSAQKASPVTAVLGFADKPFLTEDFMKCCGEVCVATESGGCGVRGNVMDLLKDMDLTGAAMYACGPAPMLKTVSAYAEGKGIPLQISLEERMACGIGSCLGCAVETVDGYKRVCKDGPVFHSSLIKI